MRRECRSLIATGMLSVGFLATIAHANEPSPADSFEKEVDSLLGNSVNLAPGETMAQTLRPVALRLVHKHGKAIRHVCQEVLKDAETEDWAARRRQLLGFVVLLELLPDDESRAIIIARLRAQENVNGHLELDAISQIPGSEITRVLSPIVLEPSPKMSMWAYQRLAGALAAGGDALAEKALAKYQGAALAFDVDSKPAECGDVAVSEVKSWKARNEIEDPAARERFRVQELQFRQLICGRREPKVPDTGHYELATTAARAGFRFEVSFLRVKCELSQNEELIFRAKTAMAIASTTKLKEFIPDLKRIAADSKSPLSSHAWGCLVSFPSLEASRALEALLASKRPSEWSEKALDHLARHGDVDTLKQIETWLRDPECRLPRRSLESARDGIQARLGPKKQ